MHRLATSTKWTSTPWPNVSISGAAAQGLPEPVSASTMTKPPSAELAPDQTDQDTLPPYELLDTILRAHIEGGLNADDLVAKGHEPATVMDVLTRLERNEHKRWQMPPAPEFHLAPLGKVGDVHSLQTMIGEAWSDVGELKKWIFHGLLCPAPSRTLPAIGSLTLTTEMHSSRVCAASAWIWV